MRSDIGCELSARGRGELRYAIGAILFATAMATVPMPAAATDPPPHDLPGLQVTSPFPRFPQSVFNGAFSIRNYGYWEAHTTVPQDTPQYYEENPPDPGTGKDKGTNCGRNVGRSNPIYLSNANKAEFELDFADSDPEFPLLFERTYNHNATDHYYTVTGNVWLTSFDYQFEGGTLVARRPDGSSIYFDGTLVGDRFYEKRADPRRYVVVAIGGASYALYRGDGVVEHYELGESNGAYRIRKIENGRGVGWTFVYGAPGGTPYQPSAVIHTSGKRISLEYSNQKLVKVTDPAGNLYQYGGDSRQGSTYVIYPDGVNLTYHYSLEDGAAAYDSERELTGKSYDGVRYSRFHWGEIKFPYFARRVPISSEHAGGVEKSQFEYTLAQSDGSVTKVVETNPLGKKATYLFDKGRLTEVAGHASPLCSGSVSSITYDSNGSKDRVTDPRGNVTDYDYSSGGRLARLTEAAGTAQQRVTEYQWDPTKERMAEVKVVGLNKVTYRYDQDDRPAEVISQNLSVHGVSGQARSVNYTYTHHGNGKIATVTVDGPLPGTSDAKVLSYSATGNLLSVRDGLGNATSYSNHNGLGLPGRIEGANGEAVEYSYDTRGRVLSTRQITHRGTAETKNYYAHGLLASSISADGVETRYVYDAARRLTDVYRKEPDGRYARQRYVLNAMSQPTTVEVSRADYPSDTRIAGNVDGLFQSGGTQYVSGWACSTGMTRSIDVHLYAGGTFLASATADRDSEPAVAAACGTQGTRYRYLVPLSMEMRQQRGGQTIAVFGISPTGDGMQNLVLSGSNLHAIPPLGFAGTIDGVGPDSAWNYFLNGWACTVGATGPIDVHLYLGGPAGSGTYIGAYHADGAAEAAVGQACESSSNAHRFNIALSTDFRRQHGGKSIYVHAVTSTQEKLLPGSGSHAVPGIGNNAEIVSYDAPNYMRLGETANITVRVRNTGDAIWGASGGETYSFGKNSYLYSMPERLPLSGPVGPGAVATFTFSVYADREGLIHLGGRMVSDSAGWFGGSTAQDITVEDPYYQCTDAYCEVPR